MKIALSMMNQAWEDKEANIKICNELMESSSRYGAEILIFPEMTLTGFTMSTQSVGEELNNSKSVKVFAEMAAKNRVGIVAGLVLKEDEKYYNCAVAFDEKGEEIARYAKIYPFSFSGEDRYVLGGDELVVFESNGLRFGLTICFDLRFPVLWYVLASKCDCIVNIASWPANRVDHWRTLLQARAIENQIYVIGVNRVGVDGNNLEYEESSYAFAPDGTPIAPVITDKGFNVIEISKSVIKNCQELFPIRKDKRINLYKRFLDKGLRS